MVIQMILGLGNATEQKMYRDVLPHRLSEYREGFNANRDYYQWGELWSIRGKDKTLIAKFGRK